MEIASVSESSETGSVSESFKTGSVCAGEVDSCKLSVVKASVTSEDDSVSSVSFWSGSKGSHGVSIAATEIGAVRHRITVMAMLKTHLFIS